MKNSKGARRILIVNTSSRDPNFTYLTGFKSGLFEGNSIIAERGRITLMTNSLEYQDAKRQSFKGLRIVSPKTRDEMRKVLSKGIKGKIIGVNKSFIPEDLYERVQRVYKPRRMTDVSEAFENARLIKDRNEVASVAKAAKITKKAMSQIKAKLRAGVTEKEIAADFDYISAKLGSERPSFTTIVCFGRNAAIPHHMPDNTRLKKGDFVLIDAGATFNGYCSDITRTHLFGKGKDRKRKLDVYNTVKEAQRLAIAAIRTGATAESIHEVASRYINRYGNGRYKGRFIHSLGHSVGLEVHDGAGFSPGNKMKLKEGMVISVEPGIYIPGFGGVRIEDDILITRKGAVVL